MIENSHAHVCHDFVHKISNPFIKKAFFLASPDFTYALDKHLQDGKPLAADEKIVKSLYKYYIRMSSRCTPFGLFAGCALGTFSASTDITFGSDKFRSVSRLDMYYVSALSEYINRLPHIKEQLLFFPNETIYQVGENFRYIEFSTLKFTRKYMLSSFKGSRVIRNVLQLAGAGVSRCALIESLKAAGFDQEESTEFIEQLIESQILVSDLLPSITGEDYFSVLIKRLKLLNGTDALVAELEAVNATVKLSDWTKEAALKVKGILGRHVPVGTKDLVQTDLFFQTKQNTISRGVIEEVSSLVEAWVSLQEPGKSSALTQFSRKFEAKYGEQEVPLLVALDTENGIGYQMTDPEGASYMPLLDNIHVPQSKRAPGMTWGEEKINALQAILDAMQNQSREVDLKQSQACREKGRRKPNLPDSMFLFGSFLSSSSEDLDKGNFQFLLNGISGPSGANLLARFCHGDEQLQAKVKATLQKEESLHPEVIYAEIVHLPDGRTGNVIMRPTVRSYEIPILTKSSVEDEFTIRLQDLAVSIQRGTVVLRSKKLNRRVIPRLTNAHNYARGLPVYRFLCDLQNQGLESLSSWNWSVFKKQPFLPRVKYGKIILSRATWNLKRTDFLKEKSDAFRAYFNRLQSKYNIPDKVVLVEGDNELLLSMTCELSLNILADKLKKKDVVIQEFLFTPDNCFIKDNRGSYTNELVIPFCTKERKLPQVSSIPSAHTQPLDKAVKRDFQVGESWLYFKIFTGNKTADRILVEAIKPLAESLLLDGVIEKWFFLRYDEHGHHLRVRFYHADSVRLWGTVIHRMKECLQDFLKNGLIHKVQIDTYQREIERYGVETINWSESLFFYDSIAITEFLELLNGDQGEEYRWLLALLNVDRLLDDFGLTLYEKFQLVSQLREYFYQEANKGSQSKKLWISLNNGYRAKARDIYDMLEKGTNKMEDVREAVDCFKRRSERNRLITKELVPLLEQAHSPQQVSLSSFVSSHVHMTLNRTFLAKQRIHETVIYHYLAKYYDSKIAREGSVSKKINASVTA